jgi:predicted ATPase
VLDNCEHVVQYCAELVEVLLATSPHLTVLATSREAFGIAGESVYVVPPLTVPDAGQTQLEELMKSEAVQLFVARAQAKRTDFALTMANARAVTQVCNKLEGIPLSLELASARLTILSVEQIAARLDSRLRVLAGGSRTALPRHQSLQATLHWSYNLLNA